MSSFRGCHTRDRVVLLLCSVFLLGSPAVGQDKRPFKLPSRDIVHTAGYGEEKLSTVLVTGSVYCEAGGGPMKGVSVAVNCYSHATERKGKSTVARGVTDEFGGFIVDLPSHLHAMSNLEKLCSVKILRVPKGSVLCWPAHVKRQKGLRLVSFENGIRTYNAGKLRFQHSTSEAYSISMQPVQMGQGSREERD